jgi:hypothetical protein
LFADQLASCSRCVLVGAERNRALVLSCQKPKGCDLVKHALASVILFIHEKKNIMTNRAYTSRLEISVDDLV